MKLFLASMIRNEIDVLPAFLGHVAALFDGGCLVDHLSSDGSEVLLRAFAATRPGFEVLPLETPHFTQVEVSQRLLARGFAAGADAVIFLDADELIRALDRAGLERAVEQLATLEVAGQLRWRPCVPARYGEHLDLSAPAWHGPLAEHKKMVVPRWLHARHPGQLRLNQGNHTLLLPDGAQPSELLIGELLHFPVRSRRQLVQKTIGHYVSQALRPGGQVAPHVEALYETLLGEEISPELLNALGARYGQAAPTGERLSAADLEALGFRLEIPAVARVPLGEEPAPRRPRLVEPVPTAPPSPPSPEATRLAAVEEELRWARHELAAIKGSASWRITAPLRRLKGALERT